MSGKQRLISGAEAKKRLRRRLFVEISLRCVAVAEFVLVSLFSLGSRPPAVKVLLVVLGVILAVLLTLSVMSSSGRVRVCAHCGTKHKYKTLLSMPDDDFLCPHCGQVFQAELREGEIDF